MDVKEQVDSQYRKFDKAMTKRLEKFAPTKSKGPMLHTMQRTREQIERLKEAKERRRLLSD